MMIFGCSTLVVSTAAAAAADEGATKKSSCQRSSFGNEADDERRLIRSLATGASPSVLSRHRVFTFLRMYVLSMIRLRVRRGRNGAIGDI